MVDNQTIKNLIGSIKESEVDKNNRYSAIVSRVDGEGIVWVNIAGAEKETPTESTLTEVKSGDAITVEWRNNKLYIVGNYSNPSAGIIRVQEVEIAASTAKEAANNAIADAYRARESADSAQESATNAQTSANMAQASADNANEYAARALGNLASVQSVTETLNWITQHGTMTNTQSLVPPETELDPSHVYFVLNDPPAGQTTPHGDYHVGDHYYDVVSDPKIDDISTYYVLSIDESLNNYVATHLAVDGEGLWVLPASSGGYKVLIATGNGTQYTEAGTYIINSTGATVAMFGEEVRIGIANGTQSYLFEDYHSLQMVDKEGDTYFHISDLVDRNGNICEEFNGDGTTTGFNFTYTTNHIVEVLIDDVATTSYHGDSVYDIVFNNAPPNGSIITVKYTPVWDNDKVKAYTLGKRKGATGLFSYAEGFDVEASGRYTHSEGYGSIAQGFGSHAEGRKSTASGNRSHAEGNETVASGSTSHAEGNGTTASGDYSHAEGDGNTASGNYSHAEGGGSTGSTTASGNCSHAEGWNTTASDDYSHAEGGSTTASGIGSHAEGWNTEASGNYSHAQNSGTIAGYNYQSAIGRYNDNKSNNLFEIGYGSSDSSRKNVFEVDTDGNIVSGKNGTRAVSSSDISDTGHSGTMTGKFSTAVASSAVYMNGLVQLTIYVQNTQATANGTDVFRHYLDLPDKFMPKYTVTGGSYYSKYAMMAKFNSEGELVVRNANHESFSQLTGTNNIVVSLLYISKTA